MTTCGNVQLNRIVQSRVSMQNDRERNFHVFYYLLEGASDDDKRTSSSERAHCLCDRRPAGAWSLRPASDFIYLNRTGCYAIADENPADEYRQLKVRLAGGVAAAVATHETLSRMRCGRRGSQTTRSTTS